MSNWREARYTRFIAPVGGIIALACFFFPWVSAGKENGIPALGIQLVQLRPLIAIGLAASVVIFIVIGAVRKPHLLGRESFRICPAKCLFILKFTIYGLFNQYNREFVRINMSTDLLPILIKKRCTWITVDIPLIVPKLNFIVIERNNRIRH